MGKNTYNYDYIDVLYTHSIQCTYMYTYYSRYLISTSVPIFAPASAGPLRVGAIAAEVAIPVAALQGQWELIGRFPGLAPWHQLGEKARKNMAVFGVSSEMTPKCMVVILGPTIWAIDFD